MFLLELHKQLEMHICFCQPHLHRWWGKSGACTVKEFFAENCSRCVHLRRKLIFASPHPIALGCVNSLKINFWRLYEMSRSVQDTSVYLPSGLWGWGAYFTKNIFLEVHETSRKKQGSHICQPLPPKRMERGAIC